MENIKKIVVTGGAGYIGSHTVVELIAAGFEPIIVDDFSNADPLVLEHLKSLTGKDIKCYKVNCAVKEEFSEVFKKEKNIFGAIHFAAFKAVGESVEKALDYYDNNINSTINLLRLMMEHKVNYLVFSSSCTVYGQPEKLPVTEEEPLRSALSPYGNTKKICEEIMMDSLKCAPSMQIISLRYFNPIGAHPSGLIGEHPQGIPNNLLPYVAQVAMGLRESVTVFGNDYNTPDGTCIRDYIHVVDLAKAHIKALDYIPVAERSYEVFNVGVGKGISVLEIIHLFEKVSGSKINYKIGPRRPGDIPVMYADAVKANKMLGWKAEFSLEEAIAHTWNFQQKLSEHKVER